MNEFNVPPTIEGLRHARNQLYKQWHKERQRARDLKKRNEELVGENESLQAQVELLKKKLAFLDRRYNG
jgi:cell division protein FtsB